MPLTVGRHLGSGAVIGAARVVDGKAKTMQRCAGAAAGVQIELLTAVAVAFDDDSSVICLRITFDPGLDGKFKIDARGWAKLTMAMPLLVLSNSPA